MEVTMRAEDKLGYRTDERTRFRVRVELNDDLSGTPRVEWVRNCRSLEEAQRGYMDLRDASGYGASQIGFGAVFDEAGQLIAHISYNGRLWAPSSNGASPWRPGVLAIAEAPAPLDPGIANPRGSIRDLINQVAAFAGDCDPTPEQSMQALRALSARARSFLNDPRSGLTPPQTGPRMDGVLVWSGGPEGEPFTQGPSADPHIIETLEDGDIIQGFNARGDVLTEGVKTPSGVAWHRVHGAELDRTRHAAADSIYETAEFGGVEIIDCDGWAIEGEDWQRTLFIADEDPDAPSRRAVCALRFHPRSDQACSLSLDGEELLIPDQVPDYPSINPGRDTPEP
jgi:hypothetical protein